MADFTYSGAPSGARQQYFRADPPPVRAPIARPSGHVYSTAQAYYDQTPHAQPSFEDSDGRDAGQNGGSRKFSVGGMVNWMGAAASLALTAGIAIWGYNVVSRDVSGVPVVQAQAGPMRVAPDNPGGTLADHQGLAVNAVAGQGEAEAPADRLMLAPVPAGLAEDDVAQGAMADSLQIEQPDPLAIDITLGEDADADDPILALANQIAAQAETLSPLSEDVATAEQSDLAQLLAETQQSALADAQDQDAQEQTLAAYVGPGLARSLRPQLRPQGVRTASLEASAAVLNTPQGTREVSPDSLPTGTRLVQIGAFDSAEVARGEWARLEGRFGDYLEGKTRVIEQAVSGGKTFFRLRAHGFENLADARRFCAAFVAQKVDCIPVVTR